MAIASGVTVLLCAAGIIVYAVRWQGYPAQKVALNDGGVWVTNSQQGLLGRENTPLQQLDLEMDSTSHVGDRLNVLQNAEAVVAVDDDASEVTPVDASLGQENPHDAVSVKDPNVELGGDVVALTDPSGQVWATHVDTSGGATPLSALSSSAKPLDKSVGANAALTVSQAGTIYAASATTGTLTAIPSAGYNFARPTTHKLEPAPSGTITQMTAVGGREVWLDSTGRVGFAGHAIGVGQGAALQQPGPRSSVVLVDTPGKLLAISLLTGRVSVLATVAGTSASAPVRLGNCAWGLWAAGTTAHVVQRCGAKLVSDVPITVPADADLVFRVNRGSIFVNDLVSGDVWAVNGATVQTVANWQSLAPRQQQQQKQVQVVSSHEQAAPQAVTDNLGARAGDATVLHVLDNDRAPVGAILSISAVENDNKQISVQISPDRQTLMVQVDQGVDDQRLVFHYTIDDGERSNATATGEVDLTVHAEGDPQHAQPQLRYGYASEPPTVYPVAAGGSVDVPVLPIWRDPVFGDPIEVVPGSAAASKGTASITPEGLLQYVAPAGFSGPVTVRYAVTTGGTVNHGVAHIRVYSGLSTAPPVAEPDVASGVVGSPITVQPLDNDIPGADPVDANAQLTLAADVAPQAGLTVSTDTNSGVVTVTGSRPGSYLLPYRAAYGAAAGTSTSDIKVVVQPPSQVSNVPVATPVTTAIYGASPMTVDVLANDYDPRGRLLVVQDAEPEVNNGQLNVSVIDGRWIRVSSKSGSLSPGTQVINYTVSNGDASASSTLTVTQLPAIPSAQDGPEAQPTVATVRAGDSVDIPVLDGDSTPSGDPVGLVVSQSSTPGRLPLSSGPGAAYLDGSDVRYVAPANVAEPTDATFAYGVENTADPAAPQSSALVTVHIIPAPNRRSRPDQAPTPSELDGRVTEGGTVTLQLPSTGQDPDGDPVTVTGIGDPNQPGSEPRLGQVVAYGGDTITYQAFVGQTGADQFTYTATDPYGESAEGVVRITIVPPGGVQAPVAVDDSVTVDPSRTLQVDVLANDLFPSGTTPEMEPLRDAPPGVSARNGIITVKPGNRGTSLTIPYTDTDGLADSSANLIVHFQSGFDNPPAAGPVVARQVPGKQVAIANVLKHVTDIDDPASSLKLVSVDGAPASAIHGGTVTLPVTIHPQVWTYHVSDPEGAEAAGSIYVGGSSATLPYLKPGSVLHVPLDGSATVDLTDYVVTPKHGTQPYLTTAKEIFAEPGSMFARPVTASTQQSLSVQAGKTSGPADLVFQVSDMRNLSAKGADTAMITLPVIVGHPAPRLECPVTPISVPESGSVSVDVAAICHVWQDPTDVRALRYSGTLASPLSGVTLSTSGSTIKVTTVDAQAGKQGVIDVNVSGAGAAAKLPLIITKLPPPSMRPVPEVQAQAGKSVSINVAPYLSSDSLPPDAFHPALVHFTPTNGGPRAQIAGTTATVTPPNGEHRTYTYAIAMSDAGLHSTRPLATSSVTIVVTDVPSVVTGLHAGTQVQSDQVELQWSAPDAGGLQITKYVVSDQAGQTTCFTTTCTIHGLQNGRTYSFSVTAYNSLGPSKRPSAPVTATPDAVPGPVTNLHVTSEGDGTITYQWDRPEGDFSAVTGYLVSGGSASGYQQIQSGGRVVTDVVHATNGAPASFSVRAIDHLGVDKAGPVVSDTTAVASGQPQPPTAPTITGTNVAGGGTKAFTISWNQVAPNGRGDTYYEVLVGGAPATCVGEAQWFTATTCTVQVSNDGTSYSYQVVAANEAGVPGMNQTIEGAPASHDSPPSAATSVIAAGEPASIAVTLKPDGKTGEATLSYTAGASNGGAGTVTCVGSTFSCNFSVPAAGGTGSQTITGLTDGQSYSVELKYCNGANSNQDNTALGISPCITSDATSASPYGPILSPTLTASANETTVTLSGSVNANGGKVSLSIKDNITGATHACGTGGPTGTVTCSWSESGLRYQTAYNYTLTATDASGDGRPAVTATASATTATAPPIQDATLTGSVNGNSITVNGSVNDGGLAANVTLKDNTDGATGSCTTSGNYVSCSMSESNLSYSTTYSYTLTATDASGYGRKSDSASWSGQTGPPPSLTLGWSSSYAPASRCTNAAGQGSSNVCHWIIASTANFSGTVTCQMMAENPGGLSDTYTWTQGGTQGGVNSNNSYGYYGGTVTAQCSYGSQTATASETFPTP